MHKPRRCIESQQNFAAGVSSFCLLHFHNQTCAVRLLHLFYYCYKHILKFTQTRLVSIYCLYLFPFLFLFYSTDRRYIPVSSNVPNYVLHLFVLQELFLFSFHSLFLLLFLKFSFFFQTPASSSSFSVLDIFTLSNANLVELPIVKN